MIKQNMTYFTPRRFYVLSCRTLAVITNIQGDEEAQHQHIILNLIKKSSPNLNLFSTIV